MSPPLAEAVESFRSTELAVQVLDPKSAEGRRLLVATQFVEFLRVRGIVAHAVRVDSRPAVVVEGLVLDWAARADAPTVELPAVIAHALPTNDAARPRKWALGPPAAS